MSQQKHSKHTGIALQSKIAPPFQSPLAREHVVSTGMLAFYFLSILLPNPIVLLAAVAMLLPQLAQSHWSQQINHQAQPIHGGPGTAEMDGSFDILNAHLPPGRGQNVMGDEFNAIQEEYSEQRGVFRFTNICLWQFAGRQRPFESILAESFQ